MLLLTLTLALGTFAASVAKTLDRNYNDRVYYQTGSDLLLVESGTFDELTETWSFQPVGDHLDVKALQARRPRLPHHRQRQHHRAGPAPGSQDHGHRPARLRPGGLVAGGLRRPRTS